MYEEAHQQYLKEAILFHRGYDVKRAKIEELVETNFRQDIVDITARIAKFEGEKNHANIHITDLIAPFDIDTGHCSLIFRYDRLTPVGVSHREVSCSQLDLNHNSRKSSSPGKIRKIWPDDEDGEDGSCIDYFGVDEMDAYSLDMGAVQRKIAGIYGVEPKRIAMEWFGCRSGHKTVLVGFTRYSSRGKRSDVIALEELGLSNPIGFS